MAKYNAKIQSTKRKIRLGDLVVWNGENSEAGVCLVCFNGIVSLKDAGATWVDKFIDGPAYAQKLILQGSMSRVPVGTKITLEQE